MKPDELPGDAAAGQTPTKWDTFNVPILTSLIALFVYSEINTLELSDEIKIRSGYHDLNSAVPTPSVQPDTVPTPMVEISDVEKL
jgi:hypothetical protein